MMPRIGLGYDLHRLEAGRRFVLGGVSIPHDAGPVGHSDGDVLLHAVTDAILGAAGLGDIGDWFDDRDPAHRDRPSHEFLQEALAAIAKKNLRPVSVDTVVVLERPRLGAHKGAIRTRLAALLGLPEDRVGVKAKTQEGVDAVGAGQAVAAQAVVLLAAVDRDEGDDAPEETGSCSA
jgi:2-C-methyl-D-erythritol 2,4-cyclodiphosphate synthase